MNILISTNSHYFMPTIVMLESLFSNNENHKINIYLLYSKLNEEEVSQIKVYIENKSNGNLILLEVNKNLFANAPVNKRFTEEIYYRLLAQDIIPNNITRILYLDVDIIINKSLINFYNQDFDGKYLVVSEGIGMSKKDNKTYNNLGIPLDKKYFNSGVILYNLELLRNNFNTNTFFEFIEEKQNVLTMPDQDTLNALFYDDVKYSDYRVYNNGIVHLKNRDDIEYARKNAAIIHYIGKYKPWNINYAFPLDDLFWKYARRTNYKNEYIYYMVFNKIYRVVLYPYKNIVSLRRKFKKKIIL